MDREKLRTVLPDIVLWGALWGIFESTVGYLLHAVSFGASWLVWFPAACFFMARAYRKTGRVSAVFLVGLLAAAVKMLDLLLPGRIDKVINPALSILFEAAATAAVVYLTKRLEGRAAPLIKAFAANCGWRALFAVWLLLAPSWIREISVISTGEKALTFFAVQNLATSVIAGACFYLEAALARREKPLLPRLAFVSRVPRPVSAAFLLALSIAFRLTLG